MALPSKLILAVGGVAVLAAAGWFGYQQFFEAAPPPPPPPSKAAAPGSPAKPQAPAAEAHAPPAANPEQLIDELLAVTGLGHQLDALPEQFIAGVKAGAASQPKAPQAFVREMERIVTQEFNAQRFQQGVRNALKANFDEKRARAVIADASKPVASKMIKAELATPSPLELEAYFKSLATKPLPPQRRALLEQLDDASNSSRLGAEIALASTRAMALGAGGADPKIAAEIDRMLESKRAELSANIRQGSIMAMSYTYRDATEAELGEYIKIYQSEPGKWFMGVVSTAMVNEFKTAAGQVGEKVAAAVKAMPRSGTGVAGAHTHGVAHAAAPAPADSASKGGAPVLAMRHGEGGRNQDLRSCLELPTTEQIIKCSEQGL